MTRLARVVGEQGMAGYYALLFFYKALFDAVSKIHPYGSNISFQLFYNIFSILSCDRSTGDVDAQDPYNDTRPVRAMRRFSALFNLPKCAATVAFLVIHAQTLRRCLPTKRPILSSSSSSFMKLNQVLIPHRPTQIRAQVYSSGVTRVPGPTADTLANSPAAAYFSIGWLYVVTLQPPSRGLPRNKNGGPARQQHGWSGWRRSRAGARRSTPATR